MNNKINTVEEATVTVRRRYVGGMAGWVYELVVPKHYVGGMMGWVEDIDWKTVQQGT